MLKRLTVGRRALNLNVVEKDVKKPQVALDHHLLAAHLHLTGPASDNDGEAEKLL